MHYPTGGLLTTFLLAGDCIEEPGRGVDEFARLMAGVKSIMRPCVIISPGAASTFGAGVTLKHTPKELLARTATSGAQDCTGDLFRFVYGNAAEGSLVLAGSGDALESGGGLHARTPEYLIDNKSKTRFYIYGCPLGNRACKSQSLLSSNGVDMLQPAKDAIAACGGGVGPLFQAADVDAGKPVRQVFEDVTKTTRLSWYTNSCGGTTCTHVDSVHTKRGDQAVGLRCELATVGILPMEMLSDGSTVDGLDSLNATIGYGPVSNY